MRAIDIETRLQYLHQGTLGVLLTDSCYLISRRLKDGRSCCAVPAFTSFPPTTWDWQSTDITPSSYASFVSSDHPPASSWHSPLDPTRPAASHRLPSHHQLHASPSKQAPPSEQKQQEEEGPVPSRPCIASGCRCPGLLTAPLAPTSSSFLLPVSSSWALLFRSRLQQPCSCST